MTDKKATPPDRIRGFTSLADHESVATEGKVVISEHDGHSLRRIWIGGEWWHSIVDVVGAIAEPSNLRRYWSDLKRKIEEEGGEVYEKIVQLKLPAPDGKLRETDCATTEDLFRVVQSIRSPRAEPIKQFLAKVGAERIEEMAEPAKAVDRAIDQYRKKGHDDEWIDGRLQNISSRNELTDEWKKRGAEGPKAAPITAAMSKEMLGVTPTEHRSMKGLSKSIELRDHMDNLELAVTTLGERAAKAIITARDTQDFHATKDASLAGAKVAGEAARKIEHELGRPIANGSNFLPKPDEASALPVAPAAEPATTPTAGEEAILDEAFAAAAAAAEAEFKKVGASGPFGYAAVVISPARGKLVSALKKRGIGDSVPRLGYQVYYSQIHDQPTQGVSVHEAAANAFAHVLRAHGFTVSVRSDLS